MSQYLVGRWGEPATWPRDPDKALLGLDAFVERNLLEEPANRKSVALMFEYAQFLVPTSDLDSLAQGRAARLVRFLSWAQNPLIKRVNTAFVLIVDKLVEVNERLVQSPHVATIEIPLPDAKEREQFVPVAAGGRAIEAGRFHAPTIGRDFQRAEADESERRAVASRAQRKAARRDAVPATEEVDDRAAMPGAGRIHRAEAHARSGRRPRRGQGAAAGGREVDRRRAARSGADGLSDLRARSAPARRFWPSATPARSAFPAWCCEISARSTSAKRKATWSRCSACCGRWGRWW